MGIILNNSNELSIARTIEGEENESDVILRLRVAENILYGIWDLPYTQRSPSCRYTSNLLAN